jgi:hypothetical protein
VKRPSIAGRLEGRRRGPQSPGGWKGEEALDCRAAGREKRPSIAGRWKSSLLDIMARHEEAGIAGS